MKKTLLALLGASVMLSASTQALAHRKHSTLFNIEVSNGTSTACKVVDVELSGLSPVGGSYVGTKIPAGSKKKMGFKQQGSLRSGDRFAIIRLDCAGKKAARKIGFSFDDAGIHPYSEAVESDPFFDDANCFSVGSGHRKHRYTVYSNWGLLKQLVIKDETAASDQASTDEAAATTDEAEKSES